MRDEFLVPVSESQGKWWRLTMGDSWKMSSCGDDSSGMSYYRNDLQGKRRALKGWLMRDESLFGWLMQRGFIMKLLRGIWWVLMDVAEGHQMLMYMTFWHKSLLGRIIRWGRILVQTNHAGMNYCWHDSSCGVNHREVTDCEWWITTILIHGNEFLWGDTCKVKQLDAELMREKQHWI